MKRRFFFVAPLILIVASVAVADRYISGVVWPEPPVITPGENYGAPSDAIVLFDGKNLDAGKCRPNDHRRRRRIHGQKRAGDEAGVRRLPAPRRVRGAEPAQGPRPGRGNNGIGLMGAQYEIQVLDSYENKTYFEGQCASVYNQRPPMVNASRKPGEWQSYDIAFTAPRFDADGKVVKPRS